METHETTLWERRHDPRRGERVYGWPNAMSPDSLNISGELIAELAEVRKQLHSVIGAMPIILWAVDAAGSITLSEGQALMSLGLTPGQLVGLSVYDVYADAPEAMDAITRAVTDQRRRDAGALASCEPRERSAAPAWFRARSV